MAVKLPGALWVPISRNFTARKRPKTDCVILHVAVSEAASLAGWFNNPSAGASSHFYVRRDGTIEQYIDLDYISWANGAGNPRSITVETQGGASGEWSPAQHAANVKIIVFASQRYGVPLVQMTNSKKTSRGVGYHLLGVPANRMQKLMGRSQTGGELWSSSVGKVCPGPDRIRQIPSIVSEAIRKATGEIKPTTPSKPVPRPPTGTSGTAYKAWVKKLQSELNKWKTDLPKLRVDGEFGTVTKNRIKEWQRRNKGGAYKGIYIDGDPGPLTCKGLGIPNAPKK